MSRSADNADWQSGTPIRIQNLNKSFLREAMLKMEKKCHPRSYELILKRELNSTSKL